jgi:hypothetical protein
VWYGGEQVVEDGQLAVRGECHDRDLHPGPRYR